MPSIDVKPCPGRGVIEFAIVNGDAGGSAKIDLTPELLESTFSHLMAAWLVMDKGGGRPGVPGTWTDTPSIENPSWKVGARPLDGSITLGLSPARIDGCELWLTYAFCRDQALKLRGILGEALTTFPFQGRA